MSLIGERAPQRTTERTNVTAWSEQLGTPMPESARSRRLAHLGGLAAGPSPAMYLTWRIAVTLPSGPGLIVAISLVAFEAVPLAGLVLKTVTLWDRQSDAAQPGYPRGPPRRGTHSDVRRARRDPCTDHRGGARSQARA